MTQQLNHKLYRQIIYGNRFKDVNIRILGLINSNYVTVLISLVVSINT